MSQLWLLICMTYGVLVSGQNRPCKPDSARIHSLNGQCMSSAELLTKCADSREGARAQRDCGDFDGAWCCYDTPHTIRQKQAIQPGVSTAYGSYSTSPPTATSSQSTVASTAASTQSLMSTASPITATSMSSITSQATASAISSSTPIIGPTARCGIPIAPPTQGNSANIVLGDWFLYRRSSTAAPVINHIIHVQAIGMTDALPAAGRTLALWGVDTDYGSDANSTACLPGSPYAGYYDVNGVFYSSGIFPPAGGPIVPFVVYEMWIDTTLGAWIRFLCRKANYATGLCDQIDLQVRTRVRPDQMSQADMAAIDNGVNNQLNKYCITADSLPKQTYTMDKPICALPTLPTIFMNVIQGLQSVSNATTSA